MRISRILRKTLYRLLGRTAASFIHHSCQKAKIPFIKELTTEETILLDSVSCLVEKDSAIVDIGAHIGAWTIRLSYLVGPKGIVVAFEPIPGNFRILTKRAKRHENIRCLNIALSNKAGSKEMVVPKYSSVSSTAVIVDTADQIKSRVILKDPTQFNRSHENFLFLPDEASLEHLADYLNQ